MSNNVVFLNNIINYDHFGYFNCNYALPGNRIKQKLVALDLH